MKIIDQIIEELESLLDSANKQRENMGTPPFKKAEITILGQFSLLMDKSASTLLPLAATADLDALVTGDSIARTLLQSIIKTKALVLDDLSGEIWIPKEAKFIEYYESPLLKVKYLDPISALVSKAIKAKEKNRILVAEALKHYGDSLKDKIIANGGNIEYFTSNQKLKL
jgi:predicted nucleic acid-binding protein